MRFVDAHHHLWDLQHCHYPWLMARGVRRFFGDPTPIQRDYGVEDLLNESKRWIPEKSVHIQVGAQLSDSLRESQWLQHVATNNDEGLPNAIVAFVDLAAPDAADRIAEQAQIHNVRGVRQIIGRHPGEDSETGTDQLIADPAWKAGLELLQRAGMSFDLQLIPPQYGAMFRVLEGVPDLPVAICHCGSPWNQGPEGMAQWRHGMQRFALLPNVHCKVSGLGMFNPGWALEDIRPMVSGVIELFGPERVMFGSNFPVDKLYGDYDRIWDAYDELTRDLSEETRDRLFRTNAERYYRI